MNKSRASEAARRKMNNSRASEAADTARRRMNESRASVINKNRRLIDPPASAPVCSSEAVHGVDSLVTKLSISSDAQVLFAVC